MEQIKIDDKYEIIIDWEKNEFKCLRYGEEWRNLVGDNMVLTMTQRIQELEEVLNKVLSSFDKGIAMLSIPLLNNIRKVLSK